MNMDINLIISKFIQFETPVSGLPSFSTSLYHSGKMDFKRFKCYDHEVMKKVFVRDLSETSYSKPGKY
jgi:hypothetical protein